MSRDFWEDRDYDEEEEISNLFFATYREIVAAMWGILGQPDYVRTDAVKAEYLIIEDSGSVLYYEPSDTEGTLSEGYPPSGEDFQAWHDGLFDTATAAFWKREDACFEVQLDKQDTELPFTIDLAAMRPKKRIGEVGIAAARASMV